MTGPDLTADEAQDLAWKKLGAIVVEEDGGFVVYRMVPAEAAEGSGESTPLPTIRMRKAEIGRGASRREALVNAGAG